ncbi:unnamed protein product [Rangifer tarandus platyrhynchus]|uniref:Uncharacterized protein n=1 Tax=Rangifer tarandus platyrhynchus TaxID=3082113 RepID=A0AC59YQW6_RANTA
MRAGSRPRARSLRCGVGSRVSDGYGDGIGRGDRPGPHFCFCHLASAEARNDITTHTPMGFLQASSSLM